MGVLWFIAVSLAIIGAVWVFDVWRHRHPLIPTEVEELSKKRQRNRALQKFEFSTYPRQADAAEKKAMKGEGQFIACDLAFGEAPARVAGLLKYKKHEWIVVAFINSFHVRNLWWNKGPDGTRVWLFLREHSLREAIVRLKPDAIAIMHNHPNSDPSRYRMNIPSEADLRSAGLYDREFSKHRISLLEFICERGVPHLYYASFDDRVVARPAIVDEIVQCNGTGIFKNYALKKELKKMTLAEQVPGGAINRSKE